MNEAALPHHNAPVFPHRRLQWCPIVLAMRIRMQSPLSLSFLNMRLLLPF